MQNQKSLFSNLVWVYCIWLFPGLCKIACVLPFFLTLCEYVEYWRIHEVTLKTCLQLRGILNFHCNLYQRQNNKYFFVILSNPEISMMYLSWYQTCLEIHICFFKIYYLFSKSNVATLHSILLLSSREWDAKILN